MEKTVFAKCDIRVRPVVRYIVTQYADGMDGAPVSSVIGEFQHEGFAENVATALREQHANWKADCERLGA
jgi:hypothetical protein